MEGVTLPSSELGWFLKQKLGLDAIRLQLLETALQSRESYEETEIEVLRLFRDLHVADPLARRHQGHEQSHHGNRSPLMNKFLSSQHHQIRGPSSRSSYAASTAPSTSSFGSGRGHATYTGPTGPFLRRSHSLDRKNRLKKMTLRLRSTTPWRKSFKPRRKSWQQSWRKQLKKGSALSWSKMLRTQLKVQLKHFSCDGGHHTGLYLGF